jgi:regulator of sigma E protease
MLYFLGILFVFGVIVLVHEWGHMAAAKVNGVAVPDFAIGMGPSLVSFNWRGTRYHICALPIGGFVRIAGLEGDDALASTRKQELLRLAAEQEKVLAAREAAGELVSATELAENRALAQHVSDLAPIPPDGPQKTWKDINGFQKASILLAGPFMNFVLALVIILVMGQLGFPNTGVLIAGVEPNMPAAEAGLMKGDMVVGIAGERPLGSRQFIAQVSKHKDSEIPLTVLRGEEELTVFLRPRVMEGFNGGRPSLGVALGDVVDSTNEISLIQPNQLADKVTPPLAVGDRVVALNGEPVTHGGSVLLALAGMDEKGNPIDEEGNLIAPGSLAPFTLTVQRSELPPFTVEVPGETTLASLGIQFRVRLEHLPLGPAIKRSLEDAVGYMQAMVWGIKMLFTKVGAESVSGPVGIIRMIGDSTKTDLYTFLMVFMLINVNLGLINLMPLPALDGGRLLFVAINGLGVRINEKREALVHAIGMVMLLGMIAIVSVRDVWTWANRARADKPPVTAPQVQE